ncbi:MAG: type II toxin-antitoxin system RelE/ParE family toxin [Leptolyngbyaceae cyanobacterium bins.59]|nr:type II toxin-antitoxin system RelE/ParE family toxin [Leptolyngbyaceae cyanobacterium bins.59]
MAFRVEITVAAKLQIQEDYLWYKQNLPSFADPWLDGLLKALDTLKKFPNRCPLAPENDAFQEEVRQLLYGKQRNAYRILFTLREDIVYVLHVRHHAEARLTAEDIYGES